MFQGGGANKAFARELARQKREKELNAVPDVKEHDPSMNKAYSEAHKSEVKHKKEQHMSAKSKENKVKRAKEAKKKSPGVGRGGVRKNRKRPYFLKK